MDRIARNQEELRDELRDQISLLQEECKLFDNGFPIAAKHISNSLRKLLHDTRRSTSLLQQLALKDIEFLDTAGDFDPNNLLSTFNLTIMYEDCYIPSCIAPVPFPASRKLKFAQWWKAIVVKDMEDNTFTREQLVLEMADTDGGAHVDPTLNQPYKSFSRDNSLGWTFSQGGDETALKNPHYASIRQIGHEVLMSLQEVVPELFKQPYFPITIKE